MNAYRDDALGGVMGGSVPRVGGALRPAALSGLGVYRPHELVGNHAIAERLNSSDEWIRSRSGVVTRHRAGPDETVMTMAAAAGKNALAAAGVDQHEVDLVIVASCTQTQSSPSTGEQVASRLGLGRAGAFTLGAACAGFTYGLAIAANAVRCGSADHVLVIGSEKFSDIVDPFDRSTAFLFGDAAGAGVVSLAEVDGIAAPVWLSDGAQADVLRTLGSPPVLHMDGQAVFRWAITTLPSLARAACERAGISTLDLAAIVPHQANLRITEAMVRGLELSDDVLVARDVVDSGNTSAASIPLALAKLRETTRLQSGDRVLLLGFGAGLTAAGQVVRCP
jgi:3-oxoacyl-[acyl-carrier-protein] synthase-3